MIQVKIEHLESTVSSLVDRFEALQAEVVSMRLAQAKLIGLLIGVGGLGGVGGGAIVRLLGG